MPVLADASGVARIPIALAASLPQAKLYAQFLAPNASGPLGHIASRGLELEIFTR